MTEEKSRIVILEDAALEAATDWAATCRRELAAEGRPAEGGWPGTLPEARARGAQRAGRALLDRSMSALTHDEIGKIARITYDAARREWQVPPSRRRR